MKLFNTLSRKVEPFTPKSEPVTVYVCGITPYDTTHLGHAFTYTTADILIRLLEFKGHQVKYVQNVTDIDDDILRKAGQEDENWLSLGNRWTRHFIEDMLSLNVLPPDHFPRATEVIQEITGTVSRLLEEEVAYASGGNVYFDTRNWPDYGKLSKMDRKEMLPVANERGNIPDDPNKRDPLDFVLWQAKKTGEPAWDSPWGPGRPGWHIECSTMSTSLLDQSIDIHLGGSDLIFPHHESEIAQIEPISDEQPFVRYWMHIAMVRHEGEKMSKSLGNLVMVRDLLKRYSADALRLYMASHHYRTEWGYNEDHLEACAGLAQNLLSAIETATTGLDNAEASLPGVNPGQYETAFIEAMENDLDTPRAISQLSSLAKEIILASTEARNTRKAQAVLRKLGSVLGLCFDSRTPDQRVISGWKEHMGKFVD
jgi:L-cysteine:1D-myo-inositol 2-amino-2-deoxy-alpha-D-glucopyranoside ligase